MNAVDRELVLDGNAAGGLLHEIFGVEMTASLATCAHCGSRGAIARLQMYSQAPGVVLRCPACEQVVLRIVQAPEATYVDARGVTFLKVSRTS